MLRRTLLALAALLGLSTPIALTRPKTATDADRLARIETMYAEYKPNFATVPDLTPAELTQLVAEQDAVIVDVRDDRERAVSMLPGAISVAEFESRQADYAARPVVTYCTIGYRSGLFAAKLLAAGIDARNLAGSILAWTHAGFELRDSSGPTRRVHTYGAEWNLVADGYEAVW